MLKAERLTSDTMALGECPLWDHRSGTLMWVDIPAGHIHSMAADSSRRVLRLPGQIGCIALAPDDELIGGMDRHIVTLDHQGTTRKLAKLAKRRARMNDGAVDPGGRFWVGTCPTEAPEPSGSLFMMPPGRPPEEVITHVGLSNGIGWSPDSLSMYYIDTPTGRVDVFDFEPSSGSIEDRRPFVHIPDGMGSPDGLAVDAEGNLWVALWEGGRVVVCSPNGTLIEQVEVPVSNVTSLCFGGPELSLAYITTARSESRSPDSGGALYVLESETVGLKSYIFGDRAEQGP